MTYWLATDDQSIQKKDMSLHFLLLLDLEEDRREEERRRRREGRKGVKELINTHNAIALGLTFFPVSLAMVRVPSEEKMVASHEWSNRLKHM